MSRRRWIFVAAALLLGWGNSNAVLANGHRPVVQADADSGAAGGNPGLNPGQLDYGPDASEKVEGGPIAYSTGNLITPETDFASKGEMGLYLTRTFNNYWGGVGIFGAKWLSNFDYKLSFKTSKPTDPCYPKPGSVCATPTTGTDPLWAHLPDGRRIQYIYDATQHAWLEDKPSPIARIVRNADGSYTLTNDHHGVETYNASGYVQSIVDEQGIGWKFTYNVNNNYLTRVTHTSGRFISFHWSGGKLVSINDPQGNVYSYTYLANQLGAGLNVLSTATLPGDNPTLVTYEYGDTRFPGSLTGKFYNNIRYSSFSYDDYGDARSSLVGGIAYTFTYTRTANGAMTVAENTPSSPSVVRKITYTFVNGRNTKTVIAAGTNWAAGTKTRTYDPNGYDNLVSDFNGNVTNYNYGASGLLNSVVEANGTSLARTTQYQWDALNHLLNVTVAGDHKTTYTYDPATQRLASVTERNVSSKASSISCAQPPTAMSPTEMASWNG